MTARTLVLIVVVGLLGSCAAQEASEDAEPTTTSARNAGRGPLPVQDQDQAPTWEDLTALDLRVQKSEGLENGEEVVGTVSGLANVPDVAVTVCGREVLATPQPEFCDLGILAGGQPDDDGTFEFRLTVRRYITVERLGEIDCGEAPDRCGIVASSLVDYSITGGEGVSFSASSAIVPPELSVDDIVELSADDAAERAERQEPGAPIEDLSFLATVTGRRFPAGTMVLLANCLFDEGEEKTRACNSPVGATASESGELRASVPVGPLGRGDGSTVSCGREPGCMISIINSDGPVRPAQVAVPIA